MVKTSSQIVEGVQIVEKTEDAPKDPYDRWNWETERLWRSFQGSVCNEETAYSLKHQLISLCQDFISRGDFPPDLFELDHEFRVLPDMDQMHVVVPRWLYRWMETGEFMTSHEVIRYLESPLKDYDFSKTLLIL